MKTLPSILMHIVCTSWMFDFTYSQLLGSACGKVDCSNRGTCLGTKLSPVCICDPGYLGSRCEQAPCDSTTACHGNGLCVGTAAHHSCVCKLGYAGDHCQTVLNAAYSSKVLPTPTKLNTCTPADCNNRGPCVGTKKHPTCLCYLGYTGHRCESNIMESVSLGRTSSGSTILCAPSDCNNNGLCLGTKAEFVCACNLGYAGKRCERTPYPLCDPGDCSNHGLCIGTKEAFTCACNLGFVGERCEKAIGTLCDISDCNSQGICMGTKDAFTCLCNIGYIGHRCESRLGIDGLPSGANKLCETKDCHTNGVCVGTRQAPVCLCNLGYAGLRCEFEPLCISFLQCSANGVCFGTQKNFVCACNLGWSGPNCQYFIGGR